VNVCVQLSANDSFLASWWKVVLIVSFRFHSEVMFCIWDSFFLMLFQMYLIGFKSEGKVVGILSLYPAVVKRLGSVWRCGFGRCLV